MNASRLDCLDPLIASQANIDIMGKLPRNLEI